MASTISVMADEIVFTMPLNASMMFGSWAVVSVTIAVMSGIYGAMASAMSTIAPATISAMSVKAWAAVSTMGAQASTMAAMPSETPGKASPMALMISVMAAENALMTSGSEALMPDSRLLTMSPPALSRAGSSPAMALTTSPMADVTVASSSGALVVMPLIRLEMNSPPLARISGR